MTNLSNLNRVINLLSVAALALTMNSSIAADVEQQPSLSKLSVQVNNLARQLRNLQAQVIKQQTTSHFALHMADGCPLIKTTVLLTITSGPHVGFSTALISDPNGRAAQLFTRNGNGLDRIRYQFQANGTTRVCESLINWRAEPDLFSDSFE